MYEFNELMISFRCVVALSGRTCVYACIKLCKVTDYLRDGEIIFLNFTLFVDNKTKLNGIVTRGWH